MQTSTPRSDRSSTGSPEVTEQSRSTGVLEHAKSFEVTEKPRSRLRNSDEGRAEGRRNERQSRNSLEFDNNQGYQPEVRSYAQSRSPDREVGVMSRGVGRSGYTWPYLNQYFYNNKIIYTFEHLNSTTCRY